MSANSKLRIEKAREFIDKVEGSLNEGEGEVLYNLAKNCIGRGVIVEIGSWKGKSTIWLGKGSQDGDNIKVYAIDPHKGGFEHRESGEISSFEEFKINIEKAGLNDIIVPIVKTSEEASQSFDKDVELIFIDGCHEYESVKLDFDLWFPKVVDGGVMAFHDTIGWVGVERVVKKYVYDSNHFKVIGFIDGTTYAKKVEQNSLKDRLKNKYIFCLKYLYKYYGIVDILHLPKLFRRIGRKIIKLMQAIKE